MHIALGHEEAGFNSRTREDATIIKVKALAKISFNSRTREDATRTLRQLQAVCRFNSRTREDATEMHQVRLGQSGVSIHAPVRMRHFAHFHRYVLFGFNSRTREDATRFFCPKDRCCQFQFTHP